MKKITFSQFSNDFYNLTPLELKEYVDFDVKRIYFIDSKINDAKTGAHAHYNEKEFFVVLKGNCIIQIDEGNGLTDINLSENEGIYVPNKVWHHFENMSSDCLICAISSTNYTPDRSDYIENYEDFIKM
ncbi:FdtA/QdtA family cupin domain-containing protein [Patescibacteria group bacterium]|nr:FdtA/QdtA family cupin domain-containing protein [Patescibacteria group bacterium]